MHLQLAMPSDAGETVVADLSVRAAAGDEAAFERLHDRLAPGLTSFFLKHCGGCSATAADLTQKTWVHVWNALRSGRYDAGRAALSTFLYAVAQNVRLQHARGNPGGVGWAGAAEGEVLSRLRASDDPTQPARLAELLDALRDCLRCRGTDAHALTDDERAIVEAVARGESERALAGRFGIAASTVNARKKSAYGKLRRCLTLKGHDESDFERLGLFGE